MVELSVQIIACWHWDEYISIWVEVFPHGKHNFNNYGYSCAILPSFRLVLCPNRERAPFLHPNSCWIAQYRTPCPHWTSVTSCKHTSSLEISCVLEIRQQTTPVKIWLRRHMDNSASLIYCFLSMRQHFLIKQQAKQGDWSSFGSSAQNLPPVVQCNKIDFILWHLRILHSVRTQCYCICVYCLGIYRVTTIDVTVFFLYVWCRVCERPCFSSTQMKQKPEDDRLRLWDLSVVVTSAALPLVISELTLIPNPVVPKPSASLPRKQSVLFLYWLLLL